jgi:hypothetical protein
VPEPLSGNVRQVGSIAMANVVNGTAIALFQIAMTALVARSAGTRAIPVWSLAASAAGFVPLLSCNVSTVVVRRLASRPNGASAAVHLARVIRAARHFAGRLTTLGFVLAALIACAIPFAYSALVHGSALTSACMIGSYFAASCWVVYSQPEQGWFVYEMKNWTFAKIGIAARLLALAVFLCMATLMHAALWVDVVCAGAALWCGSILMKRFGPNITQAAEDEGFDDEFERIKSLARSLGAWGATSAATQAATIPLIALVAPQLSAPMFLAFTLIMALVGFMTAAGGAVTAPLAAAFADENRKSLTKMTIAATAALWLIFTGGALAAYVLLRPLMTLWVGARGIDITVERLCFVLLAMQHGLRTTGLASSTLLAVGAKPRILLLSPLTEAAVIVLVAWPLAFLVGPYAFVIGLAAAGTVGTLAVVQFAVREVLGAAGSSLRLGVIAFLLGGVVIWGGIAVWLVHPHPLMRP